MVAMLVEIIINEQIAVAIMYIVNVRITPIYNTFEMPSNSISEHVILKIFLGIMP